MSARGSSLQLVSARGIFSDASSQHPVGRFGRPAAAILIRTPREGSIPHSIGGTRGVCTLSDKVFLFSWLNVALQKVIWSNCIAICVPPSSAHDGSLFGTKFTRFWKDILITLQCHAYIFTLIRFGGDMLAN